jgi:hypothetical protein
LKELQDGCKLLTDDFWSLTILSSDSSIYGEAMYNSSLHPYSRDGEVVVRFAGTPVYMLNNTEKLVPDAVLVYGDIANGKAAITETAVASTFQNGKVW